MTKKIVVEKNGYLFNEKSKKLEAYELIKAEFCLNPETPTRYFCKLGGVETAVDSLNLRVYESLADFERGNSFPPRDPFLYRVTFFQIFPTMKGIDRVWAFRDGDACCIDISDISLTFDISDYGVRTTSGEKFYETRQDVYKYNDYIVKDADGNERTIVSPSTKLQLTDKQKELVESFKSIVEDMGKENLHLIYDTEYSILRVLNKTNIRDWCFDYNDSCDEYINVRDLAVDTDVTASYLGTDESIFASFNE